jgi:parallel beta-helix repeat protein
MNTKPERITPTFFLALIMAFFIFNAFSPKVLSTADLTVHNVSTGLSYSTVQEAINANETADGHVIRVDAGTYYEQVVVNKSLTLIGQDKFSTIIDGNGSQTILQVTAQNVTVFNFTLQNTTSGYGAIQLYYSQGDNISDNIIRNTYYGIYIYNSQNNTINNIQGQNNSYSGVYLYFSNQNSISNCIFSNNTVAGFLLYNSSRNLIHTNTLSNSKYGITLTSSDINTVHDNNITKAEVGIRAIESNGNLVYSSNVSKCTSGIQISSSNNNIASNNILSSNNATGILVEYSPNTVLLNNVVQDSDVNIRLSFSTNNTLWHNTVAAGGYGIQLSNAGGCTINENNATQNDYGISLVSSNGSTFWANSAQENQYGISLYVSANNTILDNNFLNNTQQLASINSTNYLDNGVEGNYWSDYNGTDLTRDGIGDTPFIFAENNTDNHPLMGTFSHFAFAIGKENYDVTVICNSTISELQFDEATKILNFNVTSPNDTDGFCRVLIPKILISGPQVVLIDNQKTSTTALPLSNTTHEYLYFTYVLSPHQVTIMSESYYNLLEEYNALLTQFQDLNSTYQKLVEDYNTLVANYNSLGANYSQLQNSYNNLNTTYQQLTGNYQSLLDTYNTLSAQYASLNSTYNSLQTSFNELKQKQDAVINEVNNTRNLLYTITATFIVAAAILLSMNVRFRQKIGRQEKIIQSYNPLDIARILFMSDVEKRGAKIEEFEKKHGVKIRPRDSIEEVLESLEKKNE